MPYQDFRQVVLAGRTALGAMVGESRRDIPANLRFYAGGGGSVRGFGYQLAGQLDDDHNPIGGRSLLGEVWYAEARHPTGPFGERLFGGRLENGIAFPAEVADSPNFVALMQFVDWLFYSEEGQEFAKWGVEGETFTKSGDERTLNSDITMLGFNPGAPKHLQKDFGFYNGVFVYGGKPEIVQAFFSEEEQEFQKVMNARKPVAVDPPYPFTDEEREMATLWETPLKDFVFQQSLQFILGQRPFTQWDAYLTELKGKNMQQYVDLVNKAADRYKAANPGK